MLSRRTGHTLGLGLIAAMLLSFLSVTGCSQKAKTSYLADHDAVLPAHVWLPAGFAPLKTHYMDGNSEDHYNGWPRYIVSVADNMVMVYVPTQSFMIGGGQGDDEIPSRTVSVPHFYIDIHEVTNSQFDRFQKQGGCSCSDIKSGKYKAYYTKEVNHHHPVRNVSWVEAWSYAGWIGKELPTEAQWEAAARGGDGRIYPWGNDTQVEQARYLCNARTGVADFDGYEFTAPVLNYAAGVSPYGAFNMAGNVAEWCLDWYDPSRYAYPSEEDQPNELIRGAKPFGNRNYPNPRDKQIREMQVGPLRGGEKVVRGGSFTDPIEGCRVDSRMGVRPFAQQHNIGFRCVLLLPPEGMQASAQ